MGFSEVFSLRGTTRSLGTTEITSSSTPCKDESGEGGNRTRDTIHDSD